VNLERLEAARAGDDPAARRRALDRLGDLYWQIGNYPAQIAIDRELVALDPGAKEPRRRLAEALLQQGETRAALRVARSLYAEDPDYRDIAYLYAVAEQIELNERWRRSRRGSGATSPAR
jgi:tetratricopeptide (TPR) repeat protein